MIRSSLWTLAALLTVSTAVAETPADNTASTVVAETPADKVWVSYGAAPTVQTAPIPAADFLADPSSHVDKTVLIEGTVADVCQKKGCWMVLADGDKSIRVLTKDHKYGIAMDSTGQTCRIEGTVKSKEIKPEEVAHFEEEAANKDLIPEKKVEGTKTFELVATSIQLLRAKE